MYSKEQFPNKFSKYLWSSHHIPGTQYPKLFTVCEPKKKKILVHETDQACLRVHFPHVGVEYCRGRRPAEASRGQQRPTEASRGQQRRSRLPLRIPNSLPALSHTVQMWCCLNSLKALRDTRNFTQIRSLNKVCSGGNGTWGSTQAT